MAHSLHAIRILTVALLALATPLWCCCPAIAGGADQGRPTQSPTPADHCGGGGGDPGAPACPMEQDAPADPSPGDGPEPLGPAPAGCDCGTHAMAAALDRDTPVLLSDAAGRSLPGPDFAHPLPDSIAPAGPVRDRPPPWARGPIPVGRELTLLAQSCQLIL